MKKRFMAHPALFAICLSLFFSTCNKDFDRFDPLHNPLTSGCQVGEYHMPLYDEAYPPRFPFLFKKIFDYSGRVVTEIQCSFWDDAPPSPLFLAEFYHDLLVKQNGRKVFLINKDSLKGGLPDTVATVTLNNEGRPELCEANGELNPDLNAAPPLRENFIYKKDRLFAVKTTYLFPDAPHYSFTDTLVYDKFGNILSFNGNTYQYDYSRKAKQQFYCDDFMGNCEPFYLLQYLGFFPEVNNPPNIRTHVETTVLHGDLTNHKFDREGKLIGYDFYEPVSVEWDCRR